ncbi:aminoglycoside phosphotransferase family protein [Streptomyces sp. NPDC018045]|uniref:aminoglycoside phosphotransferase family protein n=1 Tax=Streptomyces sp. NPDC018045 TaxID=3365037 RepID=UPI0037A2861C
MSTSERVDVPDALAASYGRSDAGRAWLAALPAQVSDFLARWELRRDGEAASGMASLVLPVVRADGTRAVLRLQMPKEETDAAPVGLRAWNGDGAVRLLAHDRTSGAMLLERLDGSRTLASVADDDTAMTVLAGLLRRLVAVRAPEGLRGLGDIAADMLEQVPTAVTALPDPVDRQHLRTWAAVVADLAGEPGDRLLHWDLHYGNVLAGEREPWLAIDPEPLAGDPGFDLWPALDSRWEELAASGEAHRVVRRRFDLLTDALALDRERAAGWTLGRLLQNSLWDIEDGSTALAPSQIAVAEALLHR